MKHDRKSQRLTAALLTLSMLFSLAPAAWAQEPSEYDIQLSPQEFDFGSYREGYDSENIYRTILVYSYGSKHDDSLTVRLSKGADQFFTLSGDTISWTDGGYDSVTIQPMSGLTENTYTATVEITGHNTHLTAPVQFVVLAPYMPVSDITGVPDSIPAKTPVDLSGVTILPEDASYKDIEWSVTAGEAVIDNNTLTAEAAGTLKIQATIDCGTTETYPDPEPYTKEFTIQVTAPMPPGFVPVTDISGLPTSMVAKERLTLEGEIKPANATHKDIVWSVAANDIGAQVNGNILTAERGGTVTVTATIIDGQGTNLPFTSEFVVTVAPPVAPPDFLPVSKIAGVPASMVVGELLTLRGTVEPTYATNQTIVWSVADAGGTGAAITDGVLTATAAGTVKVRATIVDGAAVGQEYTEEFDITVGPPSGFIPVTGIYDLPRDIYLGEPLTLTGTVEPSNATNQTIVWSIEDDNHTRPTLNGNVLTLSNVGLYYIDMVATVQNGEGPGSNYVKTFKIRVQVRNTGNNTNDDHTDDDDDDDIEEPVTPKITSDIKGREEAAGNNVKDQYNMNVEKKENEEGEQEYTFGGKALEEALAALEAARKQGHKLELVVPVEEGEDGNTVSVTFGQQDLQKLGSNGTVERVTVSGEGFSVSFDRVSLEEIDGLPGKGLRVKVKPFPTDKLLQALGGEVTKVDPQPLTSENFQYSNTSDPPNTATPTSTPSTKDEGEDLEENVEKELWERMKTPSVSVTFTPTHYQFEAGREPNYGEDDVANIKGGPAQDSDRVFGAGPAPVRGAAAGDKKADLPGQQTGVLLTPIHDLERGSLRIAFPLAPDDLAGGRPDGTQVILGYWTQGSDGALRVTPLSISGVVGTDVTGRTRHFGIYSVLAATPPAYTDLEGHWAREDVQFMTARLLMDDTGGLTFSPGAPMTRGEFVQILGRLAGVDPGAYPDLRFTDVPAEAPYGPYVEWAAAKGIVKGTLETVFDPDRPITRQEMAVLLQRFAEAEGYPLPSGGEAAAFADAASIAPWAADAVEAVQRAGLLKGRDGNRFDPAATATRAETAAVLHRYVELLIHPPGT